MFEPIVILKIQDPKTGLISNTFVKNAEEYTEIISNQYVRAHIRGQEEGYIFSDVPPNFKSYDCPIVYLTKEEKEIFEQMLVEESDDQEIDGAYLGGFKSRLIKKDLLKTIDFIIRFFQNKIQNRITFYYGENKVEMNRDEPSMFLSQFENSSIPKLVRKKSK